MLFGNFIGVLSPVGVFQSLIDLAPSIDEFGASFIVVWVIDKIFLSR